MAEKELRASPELFRWEVFREGYCLFAGGGSGALADIAAVMSLRGRRTSPVSAVLALGAVSRLTGIAALIRRSRILIAALGASAIATGSITLL